MRLLLSLVLILNALSAFAQHPNKIWAFGSLAGLDFNTQPPTPILTAIQGWESYASQCDEQGNLLFYTNGEKIYSKLHNLMPNGDSLKGNYYGSTSQGVQVMPHPASADKYIVITVDPEESYTQYPYTNGCRYYTVVDMTLNGGLGDVVATQKNVLIDSLFSEHTMIIGNECKMWLVTHTAYGPGFRCYEFTMQGIDPTPVLSYSGTSGSNFRYIRGEVAYDPVRQHIFLSTPDTTYANGILEMHDFDINTGVVSNPQLLSSNGIYYRLCVSPAASKLYASGAVNNQTVLDQFDITVPTAQAIINSRVVIDGSTLFKQDMAIGPDSMIYVNGTFGNTSISRIDEPDQPGLACNFVLNAIALAPGSSSTSGLPSPSVKRYTGTSQVLHFAHDTDVCAVPVVLSVFDSSYTSYLWSTGDTGTTVQASQYGTYWVLSVSDCRQRTDTFHMYDFEMIPNVIDTAICFAASATLKSTANLPNYLWSDGSTSSELVVTQPGSYWVLATDFCVESVDTFKVSFVDFDIRLPGDTGVCEDILISPEITGIDLNLLWQDGTTATSYLITSSGTYWVEASKNGCKMADTIIVGNNKVIIGLGADQFLCENTRISLDPGGPEGASYLWQDGSTTDTYVAERTGVYHVTANKNGCAATDTIQVSYEKCDCLFSVPSVFTPNADGKNDFFTAIIEPTCPVSEYIMQIYNRWGERVFTAKTPADKWDGNHRGQLAEVGTYMYQLNFKGAKDKMFIKKGDLTLLR